MGWPKAKIPQDTPDHGWYRMQNRDKYRLHLMKPEDLKNSEEVHEFLCGEAFMAEEIYTRQWAPGEECTYKPCNECKAIARKYRKDLKEPLGAEEVLKALLSDPKLRDLLDKEKLAKLDQEMTLKTHGLDKDGLYLIQNDDSTWTYVMHLQGSWERFGTESADTDKHMVELAQKGNVVRHIPDPPALIKILDKQ